MDPNPSCDLICCPETNTAYIICQLVRVFLQHMIDTAAIILIDLSRKNRRNAIFLQVDHRLAHIPLFFHLRGNLPCLPFTDPLHLGKTFRFLLNHPEGIFFKFAHDPSGKRRPYSPDCARAKIPLDRNQILRGAGFGSRHGKLDSIYRMSHILASQFQQFSLLNIEKSPHTGKFSVFILQLEHCISVIRIAEYDVRHISFNFFHLLL